MDLAEPTAVFAGKQSMNCYITYILCAAACAVASFVFGFCRCLDCVERYRLEEPNPNSPAQKMVDPCIVNLSPLQPS